MKISIMFTGHHQTIAIYTGYIALVMLFTWMQESPRMLYVEVTCGK